MGFFTWLINLEGGKVAKTKIRFNLTQIAWGSFASIAPIIMFMLWQSYGQPMVIKVHNEQNKDLVEKVDTLEIEMKLLKDTVSEKLDKQDEKLDKLINAMNIISLIQEKTTSPKIMKQVKKDAQKLMENR